LALVFIAIAILVLVGVPLWSAARSKRDPGATTALPRSDAARTLTSLRPGEPVEETFQHPDGELYLGVRRSRERERVKPPLVLRHAVPMQWMDSAPARVRFTQDRPDVFDPELLPKWDLPSDADMLTISDYEGTELAVLPVPGGFSEIHVLVKRKGVTPRVVVYLVSAGREA
jgi:hypothetical protein